MVSARSGNASPATSDLGLLGGVVWSGFMVLARSGNAWVLQLSATSALVGYGGVGWLASDDIFGLLYDGGGRADHIGYLVSFHGSSASPRGQYLHNVAVASAGNPGTCLTGCLLVSRGTCLTGC